MTYRTTVTTDAPAVWWHLDQTTGTTFTDSVAALNATITGTVTLGQTGLVPADGTLAAVFSTASLMYAEAANSATFRPTNLTVEALVRSRTATGNNRIIELGADDSWALYLNAGQLAFTVFGHGSATWTWPGDAGRHHVAGTYDGATGITRLYVDGVQVGAQTTGTSAGAPATTAGALRIAGKPGGTAAGDGWEGTLQEVALYNTVLTPTRIAAHSAAMAPSPSTLTFAGYTWNVAQRATASPYANTFSADQAWVDGSGYLHLRVDPLGGGYSTGAEVAATATGLGYGTYTCVVSGNVSTMHPNVVWGGLFTFGADTAYGNREIDADEQSKWSGSTATLSHTVWMPSSATDIHAARGGYNAAGNMTTQTAATHTAVMIWEPSKVTFRLYTGTTVSPANLFRESVVTAGQTVTFNIESGGTYTGPATIPVPGDQTVHFNLWVCPNYSGLSDPATVTAQEITVQSFSFSPAPQITATAFPAAGMVRVNVDFSAVTPTIPSTVAVTRYASDGTAYGLRGADPIFPYTLAGGVGVIDDYEAPMDLTYYYAAVANTGDTGSTGSAVWISSTDAFGTPTSWLKDPAVPSRSVPLAHSGPIEWTYPATGAVFQIIGKARPVAVTGIRGTKRGTVTFTSLNPSTIDDVRAVISTGQVLLLQMPGGVKAGNTYCHVGDVREDHATRILRHSSRVWAFEIVEVDRPITLGQAGFNSWAGATATYGTWGAMSAQTWLTVMQGQDPNSAGANTYLNPVYGGAVL